MSRARGVVTTIIRPTEAHGWSLHVAPTDIQVDFKGTCHSAEPSTNGHREWRRFFRPALY